MKSKTQPKLNRIAKAKEGKQLKIIKMERRIRKFKIFMNLWIMKTKDERNSTELKKRKKM